MKKIFSVVLPLILILSSSFVSFADDKQQTGSDEPLVIVRGMDFDGLYTDKGTASEQNCIKSPSFFETARFASDFITTLITNKTLDIENTVKFIDGILGSMACDENGNSLYNVSTVKYPLAVCNYPDLVEEYGKVGEGETALVRNGVEHYGEDNVYFLVYDWRLDPSDLADELNTLIEQAKKDHNSKKVDLICCSMGGIVTDFYLYEYGASSIDSLVFNSSTFCGTYVTTELFQGKVLITGDMLKNYVGDLVDSPFFVNVLDALHIFDFIADTAMKIVDKYKDYIYDNLLRDTFATMPSLWACVQPEDYEECIEYMFPTKELKERYSGLIEKTDKLHEVMEQMDSLLLSLPEQGVKVSVISGYNTQMVPVYPSAAYQSDGTLEASLMLGRAVVSETGKTLGDDYKAERLSPDKCVDLTNVLFPESTWAIRNAPHVLGKYGTTIGDFVMTLLLSDVQPSVTMYPEYPQFMNNG